MSEASPQLRVADERTCIRVGSAALGRPCTGCELARTDTGCDIQAAGVRIAALQERNQRKTYDDLVPGLRTIHGIEDKILDNPDLAEGLQKRRHGAVVLDIRGLHATNATYGREAGNILLIEAVRRLNQVTRPDDIGYRAGSDEFAKLVVDLSLPSLRPFARRIASVFSVERAIEDSRQGRLPIVANVAHAHSAELELPHSTEPLDVFARLRSVLLARNEPLKESQYDQLWDMVSGETGQGPDERPRDPRLILDPFYDIYCPNFRENAQEVFARTGRALGL